VKTGKLSLEVAPTTLELLFASCDGRLWPMTLTFKLDLDDVKMNQHDKGHYVRNSLSRDTQTHTHRTDCSTWTTDCFITWYCFVELVTDNVLFAPIFRHCAIIARFNLFSLSMSTDMAKEKKLWRQWSDRLNGSVTYNVPGAFTFLR